ncbi:MAG: class I SAM-dependent methyltransferase [Deltaproteobacteria bacterium]|nr:class I SAM-dependent methyltransferase [Deltaproteobacteria bacterium]
MDIRKESEKEYHNLKRDEALNAAEYSEYLGSQRKWYSIVRGSRRYYENWLASNCKGKKVLDYGCGDGDMSMSIAGLGASEVVGIDISDVSVGNARKKAKASAGGGILSFCEMDAENMMFANDAFDVAFESGVLHHLDLDKAYAELARVLKPDGKVLCNETLGHNPLIHMYRRRTPHLRTEWEVNHILHRKDIERASRYFYEVRVLGFFHLASIAAVPLRNSRLFGPTLAMLEGVDRVLLKLPLVKWQAWQVIFVLSHPRKETGGNARELKQ